MSGDTAWLAATDQGGVVRSKEGSPGLPVGAPLAGTPLCEGLAFAGDYRSTETQTLTQRYIDAGFVICGKTNTPELGILPTTEPQRFGPSRNPWNTGHSTGGSSGGSAAAVAGGSVPV